MCSSKTADHAEPPCGELCLSYNIRMEPDLDIRSRELIVSLAMDLRAVNMRAEVYRAILQRGEAHPDLLLNWRTISARLISEPDAALAEHLDAKLQPVIGYAIRGLSQSEAQALLDRIRRMHDGIQ